jgi:Zn-dependent membrane protease YugP
MYYTDLLYIIIITLLFASAQFAVNSAYSKYSRIRTNCDKTGYDLVEDIKYQKNLSHINVYKVPGHLNDHYDPRDKSVALSASNYETATIAGIAVAAHEMGHAIQDAEGYGFLRFRQAIAKSSIVASNISWIFIYLGFIIWSMPVLIIGIALFSLVVLFELVTLPVELNASKRAMAYLTSTGNYSDEELKGARKVLNAAAFTYVAAAMAGALQLLRLLGSLRRSD